MMKTEVIRNSVSPGFVALFAVLSGCDSGSTSEPPTLTNISITPAHVYAGGSVTITATELGPFGEALIYADTFALAVQRRTGDTLVVTAPSTARGDYLLRLGRNGQALGTINVAGYRQAMTHPDIGWELDAWPNDGRASVISGKGGGVMRLDPSTNAVQTLAADFKFFGSSQKYLGRTPSPGVVLLQPNTGLLQAWRLLPQATLLDTVPMTTGGWVIHQLSDSVFLRGSKYVTQTDVLRGGQFTTVYSSTWGELREPSYAVISPRGDLAVLRVLWTTTTLPVFRTATGDTAYNIGGLYEIKGAEFSDTGETLWVLGNSVATRHLVLLKLRAATGEELGRLELDEFPIGFAFDRAAEQILLATAERGATDLVVVDPNKMQVRARAHAAESATPCCSVVTFGLDGVFIVDREKTLHFDYVQ